MAGPMGAERKIGQCAVGVGRRDTVFSDALQLRPNDQAHWSAAMSAVVKFLGPARYVYGSEWSVEPPRETSLGQLERTSVMQASTTAVQVIEFERWPTFDDYRRAVSTNVRRNVRRAEKSYGDLQIVTRAGWSALPALVRSFAARRELFARKGVKRSNVGMAVRSVLRQASLRRYGEVAYLRDGDATLASYVGVNFGRLYNYLEGAADPAGKGGSWYLLMAMIERAYVESNGRGRFVMGSDDGTQAGVAAWEGLRRSREQCCATSIATSIVRFEVRPATSTVADRRQNATSMNAATRA